MKDRCRACGHPIRPWNVPGADHPGTRQGTSAGECQPCRREANALERAAQQAALERLNAAYGSDGRLSDFVHILAPTTNGRHPAECVWQDCAWTDYATSDTAIRVKAYAHATTHFDLLEETDDE